VRASYVSDEADRVAFADDVKRLDGCWVANEAPRFIPGQAELTAPERASGAFLLCVNGEPTAWTDPHGAWIDWRE
jgi:hypothetical protein